MKTITATLSRCSNGWFARSDPRQQIAWHVSAGSRARANFKDGMRVRLRLTGCGNHTEYAGRARA